MNQKEVQQNDDNRTLSEAEVNVLFKECKDIEDEVFIAMSNAIKSKATQEIASLSALLTKLKAHQIDQDTKLAVALSKHKAYRWRRVHACMRSIGAWNAAASNRSTYGNLSSEAVEIIPKEETKDPQQNSPTNDKTIPDKECDFQSDYPTIYQTTVACKERALQIAVSLASKLWKQATGSDSKSGSDMFEQAKDNVVNALTSALSALMGASEDDQLNQFVEMFLEDGIADTMLAEIFSGDAQIAAQALISMLKTLRLRKQAKAAPDNTPMWCLNKGIQFFSDFVVSFLRPNMPEQATELKGVLDGEDGDELLKSVKENSPLSDRDQVSLEESQQASFIRIQQAESNSQRSARNYSQTQAIIGRAEAPQIIAPVQPSSVSVGQDSSLVCLGTPINIDGSQDAVNEACSSEDEPFDAQVANKRPKLCPQSSTPDQPFIQDQYQNPAFVQPLVQDQDQNSALFEPSTQNQNLAVSESSPGQTTEVKMGMKQEFSTTQGVFRTKKDSSEEHSK